MLYNQDLLLRMSFINEDKRSDHLFSESTCSLVKRRDLRHDFISISEIYTRTKNVNILFAY